MSYLGKLCDVKIEHIFRLEFEIVLTGYLMVLFVVLLLAFASCYSVIVLFLRKNFAFFFFSRAKNFSCIFSFFQNFEIIYFI